MLALAQALDSFCVGGITGQVKPAQPTNGYDRTALQQSDSSVKSCIRPELWRCRARIHTFQPDRWSTGWAGDRLRVKAPVGRLHIFAGTGGAHGKVHHRGVDTIVGNFLHDGKARSTVGAVREWVAVATFSRIQHFGAAGCANRSIRSNTRTVLASDTFGDAEVLKVQEGVVLRLNILDLRQRWRFALQPGKK